MAYQNLYSNTNGIQDAFAEYWKKVATSFKSSNNVIGYEVGGVHVRTRGLVHAPFPLCCCLGTQLTTLAHPQQAQLMNEPFAGYWYKDPLLMVPGVADKKNLAPMYDRLNGDIRTIDPEHNILFESVTWDDFVP